jgi:hypothetical protein
VRRQVPAWAPAPFSETWSSEAAKRYRRIGVGPERQEMFLTEMGPAAGW